MKKLLILALILVGGVATADSTITSKQYVDAALDTLQSQIPAKNIDTVLTHTGTAGEIGEKKIYNTNNSYGEQTDALVTAGAFNSAVQNALESEFVCTEWQGDVHDNAHCLLYEVRGATQRQILPDGFTQLEYLESTGTQYINTGIAPTNNVGMSVKYAWTKLDNSACICGSINPYYALSINTAFTHMTGVYGPSTGNAVLQVPIASVSVGTIYQYDINLYNSGTVQFVGLTPITTLAPKTFDANGKFILLFSADSGINERFSESRIYHMQITDGSALVRNFIPARRNSDGELGMYDLVSGNFFMNSGTDEFVAGPVGDSNLYLTSGN